MKRLAGILIAVALVSAGLAQGTFTIRRPLDGSTVRENVKIRIPRSGISDRQYIGVTVNGRFIEAAIPEQEGDDWVYTLDTKAMDVPDGACTIELVLYQDNGDQGSVVVDRTSVDVTVDNFTSIGADPEGVRLRYRFPVGSELIYFTQLNAEIETLSAAAAANNQRGNKRVLPGERVRFAYSIMNSYAGQAGREGLMSIQPRPEPGRDTVSLTITGETQARVYRAAELAPWYMRITDTGREVFSDIPDKFGVDGGSFSFEPMNLYGFFPWPVLPFSPVQANETFAGAFLQSTVDLQDKDKTDRFFATIPVQGRIERFEWYRGIPTAKIVYRLNQNNALAMAFQQASGPQAQGEQLDLTTTVYFDINRGRIVDMETRYTQTMRINTNPAGGGAGGGAGAPNGGRVQGAGGAGGPAAGRGGGSAAVQESITPLPGSFDFTVPDGSRLVFDPQFDTSGNVTGFWRQTMPEDDGPRGGGSGEAGARGGGGGGPAFGGGGNRGGTARSAQQVIRISRIIKMTLQ